MVRRRDASERGFPGSAPAHEPGHVAVGLALKQPGRQLPRTVDDHLGAGQASLQELVDQGLVEPVVAEEELGEHRGVLQCHRRPEREGGWAGVDGVRR